MQVQKLNYARDIPKWVFMFLDPQLSIGVQWSILAPLGVSTRDPSSERRNYLGEKWPEISTESCDFHVYTFLYSYMGSHYTIF